MVRIEESNDDLGYFVSSPFFFPLSLFLVTHTQLCHSGEQQARHSPWVPPGWTNDSTPPPPLPVEEVTCDIPWKGSGQDFIYSNPIKIVNWLRGQPGPEQMHRKEDTDHAHCQASQSHRSGFKPCLPAVEPNDWKSLCFLLHMSDSQCFHSSST